MPTCRLCGYVYDTETCLYYLQSRYYDPKIGRFINGDGYASTGQGVLGCNMFAYCLNNPICMADYDGRDAIYVVTVGEDGLPVVGHALLYFQDAKGIWYVTEYTGPNKPNAKVYIRKTTEEEMQAYISSNGRYAIYIDGDFSACYDLAMEYKGTNYGGYLVHANNCLHYVKELLRAGSPDYQGYLPVINSAEICPMSFYLRLQVRQRYNTGASIRRLPHNPGTATQSVGGKNIYACQN